MTEVYIPQNGIPVPPVNRGRKTTQGKYPLKSLEVGQMIFIPGRNTKSMSSYVSRQTKNLPGSFVSRHCWMLPVRVADGVVLEWQEVQEGAPDALEGTGVWRIK